MALSRSQVRWIAQYTPDLYKIPQCYPHLVETYDVDNIDDLNIFQNARNLVFRIRFIDIPALEQKKLPDGWRNNILEMILEGKTWVQGNGFTKCPNIISVTFNNASIMHWNIFSECINLKRVVYTNNRGEISHQAFRKCLSLETVILPPSIKRIRPHAFYYCVNLKDILTYNGEGLPPRPFSACHNLKYIDSFAFQHCHSLETIELPENIREIGQNAFSICAGSNEIGLRSIRLSTGLYSIPQQCFWKSSCLQVCELPESIKLIKASAFDACKQLQYIDCSKVEAIREHAFYECEKLEKIDISSCKSIHHHAFAKCTSLRTIVIPETMKEIEESVFENCEKLVSVSLGKVKKIRKKAFYNCKALKTITIPGTCCAIEAEAFYGCSSLQTVHIKDSRYLLFWVGNNAFPAGTCVINERDAMTQNVSDILAAYPTQNVSNILAAYPRMHTTRILRF